ncbi:LysR family transcriptional regulator [Asticcacaulis sp. AND118]|uniref:LysR family transcriptional regulator n=1 Tax=Asticcacaulis sp. AND118 TaxID=2840468 RepID=UPI0021078B6C|nr:LysR family transcriptional regulator [Asticcacaulis sp. AND118]
MAVADAGSFRLAADRLGVTRSAVSQSMRRLEDHLGISLVSRTTRSFSLTEAGQRFYAEVAPAMAELNAAAEAIGDRAGPPVGLLRLAVSSIAERFISGPLLASFIEAYPAIELDVTITDDTFDIVAERYDAGVRLGEVIAQDMIAVPVSGDQRQLAFAAPAYIERYGAPGHPRDLIHHRCIGWRPAPGVAPYRWEFTEEGRDFNVEVSPNLTTNDMGLMVRTACAGGGVTFGMEETFRASVARGELVPLLEAFSSAFPGFYLYFPSRRNLAPKLRALIDHARVFKG